MESLFRSGANDTFVTKKGGKEWNTYEEQVKKFLLNCLNLVPYSGKFSRGLIFVDRQSSNILQFNFMDATNRANTCMYKCAYFVVYESTMKSTKDCTLENFLLYTMHVCVYLYLRCVYMYYYSFTAVGQSHGETTIWYSTEMSSQNHAAIPPTVPDTLTVQRMVVQ